MVKDKSYESAVISDLNNESDRAAAIIAVTILEDRLAEKLRSIMTAEYPSVTKNVFSPNAPLGGFASKNDIAFLLKLYGPRMHEEMQTLNWIRNRFAHRLDIKDFKSEAIVAKCKKLTLIENYVRPMVEKERDEREGKIIWDVFYMENPSAPLNNARARFTITCSVFMQFLYGGAPPIKGDIPPA